MKTFPFTSAATLALILKICGLLDPNYRIRKEIEQDYGISISVFKKKDRK